MKKQPHKLAENPININEATADRLEALRFLNNQQIDNILLYVYQHPLNSLYELQLIPGLHDYDIRNLLPFVTVAPVSGKEKMYFREVFRYARHELLVRADARNIEHFEGDPAYVQGKYRFNYQDRVQFGFRVQRAPAAPAKDMLYGGYIQLNALHPVVKTIVAGFT